MKERYGLLDKESPYEAMDKPLRTDITNLLLPALFSEHDELFLDREDARDILFALRNSSAALIDEKASLATAKRKLKLGDGQAGAALEDKPSDKPSDEPSGKPESPETEVAKECQPDPDCAELRGLDQAAKDAKIEEILLAEMQNDEPLVERLCRLGRLHSLFLGYEASIKLDADDDWVFGDPEGDVLEDIQGLIDFIKSKGKGGGGGSADASTQDKDTETPQDLPTEASTLTEALAIRDKPVKQEQTQVCRPDAPSASVAPIEIADSDTEATEDPTATTAPGPAGTQQLLDVTNAQETAQPEHVQVQGAQSNLSAEAEAEATRELEIADAEKALNDLQMKGVASSKLLEQDHHHGQKADKLRAQTEEVVAVAAQQSETADAAAAQDPVQDQVAAGESALIDYDKSGDGSGVDEDYHDKVVGSGRVWLVG